VRQQFPPFLWYSMVKMFEYRTYCIVSYRNVRTLLGNNNKDGNREQSAWIRYNGLKN